MAVRLKPMRDVLKNTGSIYLHCDPTAGHYLKMLMDAIFGTKNFRNEIVWGYTGPGSPHMKQFNRKHDLIYWFSKGKNWTFNRDDVRIQHKDGAPHVGGFSSEDTPLDADAAIDYGKKGKIPETWWVQEPGNGFAIAARQRKQYVGYPTQKPLAILERIVRASSNKGDVILDPFCGCGTALFAAERLKRKWIGIDISVFSAGLVKNRLYGTFDKVREGDKITVIGSPYSIEDAINLASTNKFEFEKWVCGEIGAEGMFHNPGERGADGGVDGVIPFYYSESGERPRAANCIVQVKGGRVSPDNVKALASTVRQFSADCGVFVCFEKYMRTVNNNREKRKVKEHSGGFDFIQGLSVEELIVGERPKLPYYSGGTELNPRQTVLFK